ncbi:radical SAM protein [bacterium]|nr:radical SAM protein [bacterium]
MQFLQHYSDYLLRKNLKHAIVHVTNHCNFRCNHCFIDFSPKRDLKIEDYQRLGKQMPDLFWLDIAGGEPFLRKDLADIISCFNYEVLQIPTNGSLPDLVIKQVQKMKQQSRGQITISLSLDGLKEKHEEIRNAPGNWEQVWHTFGELRKLGGVSIKINTVINRANFDQILDLMKEVRGREPDFHSVILLRGDPMNPEFGLPPIQELRAIAPEIFKILGTYGYGKGGFMARMLRNYHKYLWNVSLKTIEQETQVIPCLAGQAHIVVMGDGSVSSCEMLPPVGNIKEKSFEEIRSSPEFKQQVRDIKHKKCHCTHNCAMFDSIMFRPASIPHLLHQTV